MIGAIHAHSQNCNISLLQIGGTATASSYNGNVVVSFTKVAKDAELDFESYNGSIDLQLPAGTSATTGVSTGQGFYGTEFVMEPLEKMPSAFTKRIIQTNGHSSYQLNTINGGGIPIRIETEKGEVVLRKSLDAKK